MSKIDEIIMIAGSAVTITRDAGNVSTFMYIEAEYKKR